MKQLAFHSVDGAVDVLGSRGQCSVVDLPWIFGYLISTFRAYLMVELVVSVPAKYRFNTVATRFSKMNSVFGRCFS